MARRRMIDPNFWGSEDVSRLSIGARMLLVGMISHADDEGRGRGNPAYLRSMVFPYDDIPTADIRDMLVQIGKWISVRLYTVNDQQYYEFANWTKWQRVDKPQQSIIPPPHIKEETHSRNDSKNDSEIHSKNDSGPKEDKIREDKIREEIQQQQQPRACEDDIDDDTDGEAPRGSGAAYCRDNLKHMTAGSYDELRDIMNQGVSDELVALAVDEACANGTSTWGYTRSILDRLIVAGIKTAGDAKADMRAFRAKRQQQRGGAPPNKGYHSRGAPEPDYSYGKDFFSGG